MFLVQKPVMQRLLCAVVMRLTEHYKAVTAAGCRRNDEDDNMDEWDQEELEKVVKQKHGAEASNKTDIICKFFLEAVEKKQYGWFWQCPNGGKDCKYRHALPPGSASSSSPRPHLMQLLSNISRHTSPVAFSAPCF